MFDRARISMFRSHLYSNVFISRVALYQASVSGLCDGTFAWPICGLSVCRSVCLSVCLSVRKVYYGKMAKWMPFGVVRGVGRGTGVLDGSGDRQRERGSFGGEFGASHCNQRGLCDAALPKLLWAGLV